MPNRLSLNIRAQSVTDRTALRAYLKAADMSAVLVLDDLTLAADIKQDLPNAVVIHRAFGDSEAHLTHNPDQLAARYAREGYGRYGVHAYGCNEPAPSGNTRWSDIIDWLVRFGDALRGNDVRGVVGNIGPGNIERVDIATGLWDRFLEMLSRTGHLRGDHDYSMLPPITGGSWGHSVFDVLDPASVQPDSWPDASAISDSTDNWHLMRGRWLNARAKAKGWRVPGIVLTECFFDRMPDLEQITTPVRQRNLYREVEARWGASGYELLKGHNTWRDAFKAYWPTWTFEEALFQILKWCDSVYPPEYVGFCQFMWCPDSPDWDKRFGYDFSRLPTLQALVAAHKELPVSQVPFPTTPGVLGRLRVIPAAYVNIRRQPAASAEDVGDLKIGDEFLFWPDEEASGWVAVRYSGGSVVVDGWVSLQRDAAGVARVGIERLTVPDPEPDEPPDEEPPPPPDGTPPEGSDPGLVSFLFTKDEAQQMVNLTREKADKVETAALVVQDIFEMQRQVAQLQLLIAEKEEGLHLVLQDHAHIERRMADIIEAAWKRGSPATATPAANVVALETTENAGGDVPNAA